MEDTQIEQVEQTEVNETEPTTEQSDPENQEIQMPESWDSELKDFITGIQDQAGKKAVFDKIKNYEKGYYKKFEALADERKAYEAQKKDFDANKALFDSYSGFDKSIDMSMRPRILAQYGSVPNYMSALHQMDIMASRQPVEFIKNFCINNGITMEKLSEYLSGQEYQNAYQDERQVRSQEDLKTQIMKELEEKQAQQRYEQEVITFAKAKNETGDALHPLMADQSFVSDMEALQTAYPNKTLDELYQMASYLRPDLRQQAIYDEAKKIAEAKEVEKAKSAVGVKTRVPTHGAKPDKDWLQVLDEQISPYGE